MNNPRSVPGPDSLNYQTSRAEAEALTAQIDLEEKTNKHRRAEKFRDLFSSGLQRLIGIVIFVMVVTLLVVAWHHLTPAHWHWLNGDQLADLRTFIFSGAVISAVTTHIQRHT